MKLNWERWGVVIPAAGGKESWRATRVANPDLVQLPDGRWRMYYNGGNFHHRVGKYGAETIGFAELRGEQNGRPAWRDFWRNPALLLHEGAPIEAAIDPAVAIWHGQYWMFVSAWRQGGTCFIGLATSNDGLDFKPYGKAFRGRAPEVVVKDDRLWLFYVMDEEKTYRIHLAVSGEDGEFAEHPASPVLSAVPGTWEGQSVTTPRIYEEAGWYYMVYSGDNDDKDYPPYFGLARSHDLIHWERWAGNPFFERGSPGEPDEGAIWWGELFRWNRGYVLYYEGYSRSPDREKYGGGVSQICAAYLELSSLASLF